MSSFKKKYFLSFLFSILFWTSLVSADTIFQTEIPLADGSAFVFKVHDNFFTDIFFRRRIENGTPPEAPVHYEQVKLDSIVTHIPILESNVPQTPIFGVSLGIHHKTPPSELWAKINDEWHLLLGGQAILIPEHSVPTHVTLDVPFHAHYIPPPKKESLPWRMAKSTLEQSSPLLFSTLFAGTVAGIATSKSPWKMLGIFSAVFLGTAALYTEFSTVPQLPVIDFNPFQRSFFLIIDDTVYLLYSVRFSFDSKKDVTGLIRLYDNKIVLIDHLARPSELLSPQVTSDGIFLLPGSNRKISLRHFDLESEFVPLFAEPYFDPLSPSPQLKDPVEEVKSLFRDARELTKKTEPVTSKEDIEIIDQLKKNILNPQRKAAVILGPSGAGKTTLALNLFEQLPPTWIALKVDSSSLGAATTFVGQFESRVKAMLLASKQVPIIWFLDEMHSLQGTGRSMSQHNDFYEAIKGALSSGEMMLLGTDTSDEYYEAFAANSALLNRLNVVRKEPPQKEQLMENIKAWSKSHHYPIPSDLVLDRILEVSELFNPIQAEPKRSVTLTEQIYSLLIQKPGKDIPYPTIEDVNNAAKELYQFDPSVLDVSLAREKIKNLIPQLDNKIIGLDYAKATLLSLAKRSMAGLHDGQGPRVSCLLFGPPGTGKTELAFAYAEAMNLPITRIELNRISGFQVSGEDLVADIAAALRKNSFAVILLDEVEKASPDVIESLLAMFDKGSFNSRERVGHFSFEKRTVTVSARNATFILTSNAGTDWIYRRVQRKGDLKKGLALSELPDLKQTLISAGISAPFLDRIQTLIPITLSGRDHFKQIMRFHIQKQLQKISAEKKIAITLTQESDFLSDLTAAFYNSRSSNRDILRMVIRYIDEALANALLDPLTTAQTKIALSCAKQEESNDFHCEYLLENQADEPPAEEAIDIAKLYR